MVCTKNIDFLFRFLYDFIQSDHHKSLPSFELNTLGVIDDIFDLVVLSIVFGAAKIKRIVDIEFSTMPRVCFVDQHKLLFQLETFFNGFDDIFAI